MNVRIWEIYSFLLQWNSNSFNLQRSLYIFRNVSVKAESGHRNSMGGALIKTGERNEFGGGRRYIFHNTILQPEEFQCVFESRKSELYY